MALPHFSSDSKKKKEVREREANAPLALASSFVSTDGAKWRLGSALPSQIPEPSAPPEPDPNSSQAEPRSPLLVDLRVPESVPRTSERGHKVLLPVLHQAEVQDQPPAGGSVGEPGAQEPGTPPPADLHARGRWHLEAGCCVTGIKRSKSRPSVSVLLDSSVSSGCGPSVHPRLFLNAPLAAQRALKQAE